MDAVMDWLWSLPGLVLQVGVVLLILALFRPLLVWLFGVSDVRRELEELREQLRKAAFDAKHAAPPAGARQPGPTGRPDAPRSGWPD